MVVEWRRWSVKTVQFALGSKVRTEYSQRKPEPHWDSKASWTVELASEGWSFWRVAYIMATQSLQVTELGNEVSWPVRSAGSIERMLSTLSVPSTACTSSKRSVTQSVLLLSTFKHPISLTVGYASCTAWVTS